MAQVRIVEQCPKCALRGADNSKDNLSVYPDGHKWCYSCGYHEPSPARQRLAALTNPRVYVKDPTPTGVPLPDDASPFISKDALTWLMKYDITPLDARTRHMLWSPSRKLLIMPLSKDGVMLAYTARNFRVEYEQIGSQGTEFLFTPVPSGPKYLFAGHVGDELVTMSPHFDRYPGTVIVTEGYLDAMKVGRVCNASPLLGSHIPLGRVLKASERFSSMGIWLDPDKKLEAVKMAVKASQHISTFVIISQKDPKEYYPEEIDAMIKHHQKSFLPKDGDK